VLSDVAPEMASIAAGRATELGLDNVTTRVLDIEAIDEPDESYDVVLCREGLMFALDPGHGAGEIRRVLRAGGRVALAVWGPREANPWLGVILDSLSAQLGMPVPPPGIPGPFSLSDAGVLAGLLRDAELAEVAVDEVAVPMRVPSFDDWFSRTSSLAGPLAGILAGLPDETKTALRARMEEAVREYETPDGLEFPGVSLLATARRA
jgi:SAM-dependent methyltransferase